MELPVKAGALFLNDKFKRHGKLLGTHGSRCPIVLFNGLTQTGDIGL